MGDARDTSGARPVGHAGARAAVVSIERTAACPSENDLLELLAGAREPVAAEALRVHIDRCEDCRAAVAALLRGGSTPRVARRPGDRVGRYRISRRLGAGAMGVVYAAHDPELGREVALKLLRPAGDAEAVSARLRRESQALARVSHPNVTAIYDVGVDHDPSASGPVVYVAIELVDGMTLRRWLDEAPRPWREVVRVMAQAARGLLAAHEAGIVHRDVKPENVLVGRDGRVRVTDFGLAHLAASDTMAAATEVHAASAPTPGSREGELTETGTLVGTPAYMAPEQFEGLRVDARSDQFALCVVMYEALFGQRPFAGRDLESLASAVLDGRLERPPSDRRTPTWLRALVQRGLAREPGDRFASLQPIVDALGDPPRPWTRSAAPLVLGTACLLGLAAWPRDDDGRPRACADARAQLHPAWGPERRNSVAVGIHATGTAFADDVAVRVREGIDRWSERWVADRDAVCEAAGAHADDARFDLRLACLERGRRELAALTGALASADVALVGQAVQLVDRLPDSFACRDPELGTHVAAASAPEIRERIAELRTHLAEADVRLGAGQGRAAETVARDVLTEAVQLGDEALRAEALLALSRAIDARLEPARARDALLEAAYAAEAAGHDEVAARAWIDLVYVIGYLQLDFTRAREISRQAEAAITRQGGDVRLELDRIDRLAVVENEAGEEARAAEALAAAIDRAERELGSDALELAQLLDTMAMVERNRGALAASVAASQRSLAIRTTRLGPHHPGLVATLSTLAGVLTLQEDVGGALPLLHRALAIQTAAAGHEHPDTATLLSLLAFVYEAMPAPVVAIDVLGEAIDITQRTTGPDDANLARMLGNRARLLGDLERWDEAEADAQRFVDIVLRTRRADHPEYATALYFFGNILRRRGDAARALPHLQEARAIYARTTAVDHPDALELMATLGATLADLERWDEAATIFAAALAVIDDNSASISPDLRAEVSANLGEALWESGGDRLRARELVWTAALAYHTIDPAVEASLTAWLAAHDI